MNFSTNAISAKARGMYSKRLSDSQYDELLKRRNVNEAVSYLKSETDYAEALEELKESNVHRAKIESLLQEKAFLNITRLIHYAPKKQLDFYKLGIEQQEIHLIFHKIQLLNNHESESYELNIPTYLAKYASFDIYGLLNIHDYPSLCAYLKKTSYYKMLKEAHLDKQGKVDINFLLLEAKRLYYAKYEKLIHKYFKGQKRKDLMLMINTQVELENITKIYRLKKYFNASSDQIRASLLLEHSRIPARAMDELIETKDADEFLKKLSESAYKLYVDDKEFVFIEYYAKKIEYHLAKRYMRFSTDPALVFMTYSILINIEIENLKHIIEGVRYGEEADKVKQMLIY